MALLTALALTFVSFAPQGDPETLSVLSDSDMKSLNGKVQAWFEVWMERTLAEDTRTRRRLQANFQKAKDAFDRDWESKQTKYKVEDLLKYVDDLEVIFANAFPYKRQSTSGDVKRIKPRDPAIPPYAVAPPRNYREKEAYRTIVVMPGYVNGKWETGEDHFDATWKGSDIAAETIFVLPAMADSMDLDPAPDWSQPGGPEMEMARNTALFMPLRDVHDTFRVDRSRLLLDCGKESSGWGLRFATYFPSRFAGLILRDPVDPGDLRLESLTGVPILLVRTSDPQNIAAVNKIETALNGFQAGSCTVIEAQDAYPFLASQGDIQGWAKSVQRDLFRKKVVLAPNNDLFNDGYWVYIHTAEGMAGLAPANQPKLVVQADRQTNRIEVEAVSVGRFELLLNDKIVDLDKEFTVVVNGKALTQKRGRSLNSTAEGVMDAYDPTWIFTARLPVDVPKDDGDGR